MFDLEGGVRLDVSAASDRGRVRALNEDSLLAVAPVFAVADGMGGHSMGDRASAAAIAVLRERLVDDATAIPTPADVVAAVVEANRAVRSLTTDDERTAGTTLAAIVRVSAGVPASPHWMVVNIGDSRVYRWDGRELRQVSVDHSAVQELLDRGEIDAFEAATHPERNVVTRALGVYEPADPDVWLIPAAEDTTFLICSDGLSREVADLDIARALAGAPPEAMSAAEHLVALALEAGGRDNVTAIVVSQNSERTSPAGESTRDGHRFLEETLPRN